MSKETYSQDIEKTKKALIDAFNRLKDVHEDIEKFNAEDNFDELEISTARRESLFDRVEYLRARLQPEAADWIKSREKSLPGEIAELKDELNQIRQAIDEKMRPDIQGILLELLEIGAEPVRSGVLKLPDGYSKYLKSALGEYTNTSDGAQIRKSLAEKVSELRTPTRVARLAEQITSQARIEAQKNGYDHQRHFLTPCYRGGRK